MSLNLDKIFLPLLKILPCYEAFFGNSIFAIIARMLRGNHLKNSIITGAGKSHDYDEAIVFIFSSHTHPLKGLFVC